MNKQELFEKIEGLNKLYGEAKNYVSVDDVLNLVKQLVELQKITVPQFVADVIEGAREKSPELEDALHYTWGNGSKEFTEWYKKKSNRDHFARAWLDGYTVEKEKRYRVKVKGVEECYNYLNYRMSSDRWFFSGEGEPLDFRTKHTSKQLEIGGFGWVFDCPGVEVEEVEDDSKV